MGRQVPNQCRRFRTHPVRAKKPRKNCSRRPCRQVAGLHCLALHASRPVEGVELIGSISSAFQTEGVPLSFITSHTGTSFTPETHSTIYVHMRAKPDAAFHPCTRTRASCKPCTERWLPVVARYVALPYLLCGAVRCPRPLSGNRA